jgi:CheY-like chemotaxis protein
LRILDSNPAIRVLFTDVGLPGGMNGRQLADEARRRRPNLKVLFTAFVSPLDQVASILMSSPGPVGMFLICKAAVIAPPTFESGCPERTESVKAVAPAALTPPAPSTL